MGYKYIVVWFNRARLYLSDKPRPLEINCRPFRSLDKARDFSNKFIPKALIYKELSEESETD